MGHGIFKRNIRVDHIQRLIMNPPEYVVSDVIGQMGGGYGYRLPDYLLQGSYYLMASESTG